MTTTVECPHLKLFRKHTNSDSYLKLRFNDGKKFLQSRDKRYSMNLFLQYPISKESIVRNIFKNFYRTRRMKFKFKKFSYLKNHGKSILRKKI